MKVWRQYVGLSVALALIVLAFPSITLGEDLDATANRLVNQCAAIHEGDLVLITGRTDELELLENIAIHIRKLGAFPLLSVTSDKLERRLYVDVPARFDSQTPMLGMKLAGMIDAVVRINAEENPALMVDIPAERISKRHRALRPVYDVMLNRNVRQVELGNGLYPTAAKARQLGISLDELTSMFWSGVNVDYMKLQAIADTVKSRLTRGNQVRITNENGTDFQVRIERRPVHVNDGVISSDDIRLGKAACQVWLPAGEVFCSVVPDTADGTIVVDRHYFRGREIRDLRMTFKQGKLITMTAKSGLEPLKELYDASGNGRDHFAAIDIGINPDVRLPREGRMAAWMASGMITVGLGNNTWAGGDNSSDFALYTHLRNSTMTIDGKTLVRDGVLKP